MSIDYLYEKISSDIKNSISSGTIEPGEKIPSVSEIREVYGVSHITALKAMKTLSEQGCARFIKGKGYFAEREVKSLTWTVGAITRPFREITTYDNYFNEINLGLENGLMEHGFDIYRPRCSMPLNRKNMPTQGELMIIRDKMIEIQDSVDGFIVDERVTDQILSEIISHVTKPIVLVNRTTSLPIDSVTPDNINGAKQAAELCLKMNYEYFFVGRQCVPCKSHDERTEAFVSTLRENYVSADRIFRFDFNLTPYEETLELLEKNLKSDLKTLFFSPIDIFARWLVDSFTKRGIVMGEKIGVIGFDGMGHSTISKPHVSTVDVRTSAIGAKAADILIGRIEGTNTEKPGNYTVPAKFQIGETI